MMYEEREAKVSYQSKEEYVCPLCETSFHREELHSGKGRLIAGKLTDELHRLYEPSIKYGEVHPLVYYATVCPECWFASMDKDDFHEIPETVRDIGLSDRNRRMEDTKLIFPAADFFQPRDLISGAASLYLVIRCCSYFPPGFSPTIKQGLSSLRAGWLLDELHRKFPDENYDWLSKLFKRKAQYLYNEAIRREQNGKEALSALKIFGPDTDKNYGYEGALYLTALLKYKYAFPNDQSLRLNTLEEAKRIISKIFGVGKSSKAKPGPLLEHARNLYENINKELNETDE